MTIQSLPVLEIAGRPHRGTPQHPGGQVAMLRACLENKVVSVLNGRDSGKSVALFFLFLEEGRLCKGHYDFAIVSQGHPDAEKLYKAWLKIFEGAGRGFVVDKANKGQTRFIRVRAFGSNLGATANFWSGEADALDNLRGHRLNRLCIDEAGFVSRKVLATCGPMLLSRGGRKLFVGTARRGGMGSVWFKEQYERGVKGSRLYLPGFSSLNFPSESNPYSDPKDILFERIALRDPNHPDIKTSEEMEEFDGAFVSDIGACFRNLDACIVLPYRRISHGHYVGVDEEGAEVVPVPGRQYVVGQDHGKKIDHGCSSVFDRTTRRQVELRVEPVGAPYEDQMARLDALKKKWNNAMIVADARDAGGYINERLRLQYGDRLREISLTGQGENGKGHHVARLKHLFDTEAWHLLKVPEQEEEFNIFQQIPIGEHSNGFYYEAPSGKHDDMVTSALFASTVLQIEPRTARRRPTEVEPLSPAWFRQRQKERSRARARRGIL